MNTSQVLIVEDDTFISMGLEDVLVDAGYALCGVAGSEREALELGEAARPSFAIVDVRLSPGDGRVVACELVRRYGTAVLMATSHSDEFESLAATGALACLPKPYATWDVPAALQAISDLRDGRPVGRLPAHMFDLRPFAPRRREGAFPRGMPAQGSGPSCGANRKSFAPRTWLPDARPAALGPTRGPSAGSPG